MDRRDRHAAHHLAAGLPGERAAPEWRPAADRWPSARLVRSRFGSWDAALRAAGYRARWGRYTPDELIAALRREAASLGRPPVQRDWATGSRAARVWCSAYSASSIRPALYASVFALIASNSAWVIVPESSSSLARAISAADPPAASRTYWSNACF
jgi:hypothetical protein